jgi:hypothetical protein
MNDREKISTSEKDNDFLVTATEMSIFLCIQLPLLQEFSGEREGWEERESERKRN